jgi:hypothetical protein
MRRDLRRREYSADAVLIELTQGILRLALSMLAGVPVLVPFGQSSQPFALRSMGMPLALSIRATAFRLNGRRRRIISVAHFFC